MASRPQNSGNQQIPQQADVFVPQPGDLKVTVNVNFSGVKEKNTRTVAKSGHGAFRAMLFSVNSGGGQENYVGNILEGQFGLFSYLSPLASEELTEISWAVPGKQIEVDPNGVAISKDNPAYGHLIKLGLITSQREVIWESVSQPAMREIFTFMGVDPEVAQPRFKFSIKGELCQLIKAKGGQKSDNMSLTVYLRGFAPSVGIKTYQGLHSLDIGTQVVHYEVGEHISSSRECIPAEVLAEFARRAIEAHKPKVSDLEDMESMMASISSKSEERTLRAYLSNPPVRTSKNGWKRNKALHLDMLAKYGDDVEVQEAVFASLLKLVEGTSYRLPHIFEDIPSEYHEAFKAFMESQEEEEPQTMKEAEASSFKTEFDAEIDLG